jgi:hypothetical protein
MIAQLCAFNQVHARVEASKRSYFAEIWSWPCIVLDVPVFALFRVDWAMHECVQA